jgi:hypothetical protein
MKAEKLLCSVVIAVLPAAAALASDGYQAPDIEKSGIWKPLLVVVAAVLGICVLGFKNAKRTHLD